MGKKIEDDDIYYYNKKTDEVVWDKPLINGCNNFDMNLIDGDKIIDMLFTDTENSPIFDEDDEENVILSYMEKKMESYLESNRYYDRFLKKLCEDKNGKWIKGSSFGKSESSFDRGSKCSYKTRNECDNSYNWSLIRDNKDPAEKKIPGLINSLQKLINNNTL